MTTPLPAVSAAPPSSLDVNPVEVVNGVMYVNGYATCPWCLGDECEFAGGTARCDERGQMYDAMYQLATGPVLSFQPDGGLSVR